MQKNLAECLDEIRHIKTERDSGGEGPRCGDSGAFLGELVQRVGMPVYKYKAKRRCNISGEMYQFLG